MSPSAVSLVVLSGVGVVALGSDAFAVGGPAPAPNVVSAQADVAAAPTPPVQPTQENPIPPGVEGRAAAATGGGYCFGGPHPAPGGGWEGVQTPHMHDYAPFDLRLFSNREGCYYFIGDPRDFGYTGQVYDYYGAHPVADGYGGGWCFMIGGHHHWWRPWSPYFTVVGPWNYWYGPYDPFFWAYWPYYSFYYRSYYPGFYAGGRYFRNGYRVAPAITHVPATGWRGTPNPAAAMGGRGGWRGTPSGTTAAAAGNGWRGAPNTAQGGALRGAPGYGAPNGGWRSNPGGTWHGSPGSTGGAWQGSPGPAGGGAWRGSAPGGGWHSSPPSGGTWRPSAPSGGWHGGGSGGFRSVPGGGGGFRGSPGGGFRGGRR